MRELARLPIVALALLVSACAGGSMGGAQRIYTAGAETVDAEPITLPPRWFLFVEAETPRGDAAIRKGVAGALEIVDAKADADANPILGPPILDRLRPKGEGRVAFRAGRFVRREPAQPMIGVRSVRLEAVDAVRYIKNGPFDTSVGARRAIAQHLGTMKRLPVGAPFIEVPPGPKHAIVQPVYPAPGS